jgi:hypothetical protein
MSPLDLLWHLLNLLTPALGLALLAPALAKLVWRRELAAVPFTRLAGWVGAASALVVVGGLVVSGRDGRMATYGLTVLAAALALWWAGWRRRR